MTADVPDITARRDLPAEHLVPVNEAGHQFEDCTCKPFVYLRVDQENGPLSTEVRHNSFVALPVDEKALEIAQGVRPRESEDAIVDAPASVAVE